VVLLGKLHITLLSLLMAIRLLFPLLSVGEVHHNATMLAVAGTVWAATVLGYLFVRSPKVDDAMALNAGLALIVLMCWTAAGGSIWYEWDRLGVYEEFGTGLILMMVFPLVVPLPPRITLVVAALCALGPPIALTRLHFMGLVPATAEAYFFVTHIHVFCIGGSYFAAHVLHQYGADLADAKAMGGYQLVEKIGEGGMGQVWRARHRLLARNVAMKLIAPNAGGTNSSHSHSELADRLAQEARATAKLGSPHTVGLHDFGVTHDGKLYIVMELLDGVDLETLIEDTGPMNPERVARLLIDICDSLGDAHDVGLVHRDIKPANILLCRVGRTVDWVKVVDFGLADVRDALAEEDDGIVGTPAFMAPEIAASGEVDHRADLYALGCVGYWLLTGERVFGSVSPVAQICAHVASAPKRPSAVLGRPLPPELEDVVMACLAKSPDDRPPSADRIAETLEALAAEWTQRHARAWWSERNSTLPNPTRPATAPAHSRIQVARPATRA